MTIKDSVRKVMAGCDCHTACKPTSSVSPKFRKALWVALVLNALMFFVEIIGGSHARSVALWADALDFAGDAANYALSLAVLSLLVIACSKRLRTLSSIAPFATTRSRIGW